MTARSASVMVLVGFTGEENALISEDSHRRPEQAEFRKLCSRRRHPLRALVLGDKNAAAPGVALCFLGGWVPPDRIVLARFA